MSGRTQTASVPDSRRATLKTSVDPAPQFSPEFAASLLELMKWRRDVRHFTTAPVHPALVTRLLHTAMLAPSVGFSQPWRWVLVEDPARRNSVWDNFQAASEMAAQEYAEDRAGLYRGLKLAGLRQAPVHIAVFADLTAPTGHALGRRTMPQTALWSVVMAIHALWLAARAEGLGLGWVSILEPAPLTGVLAVPSAWTFVAYLCLGWPSAETETPLLEQAGWEHRLSGESLITLR